MKKKAMMKTTPILLIVILIITQIRLVPVAGQEGNAAAQHRLRRSVVSFAGGEMALSAQGRYQVRGTAGEPVVGSTPGADRVRSSIGFWWPLTESWPPASNPKIYLPVIFK